ncbi:tetratricopeptide repeat protein [Lysobacter terrae]
MITGIRMWRGVLMVLAGICATLAAEARPATTSGAIAMANLDYQLSQPNDAARRIELLLAKSRFVGDYDALDEAATLAEALPTDAMGLLLRARARAAAHRFEEALADLHAAAQSGADEHQIDSQRAVILIATGHANQAVAALDSDVAAHPGYASHSALASAYAELGRYEDADREYRLALARLTTTSPFPYAWIHFALGLMWSEQAGDTGRGEIEYEQALAYLPQFAAANIHQAEIEFRRGDFQSAQTRLMAVIEARQEPEALALLGDIRRRIGQEAQAQRDIAKAEQRYLSLLERQPLAFVDHAAEFYLGPGANAERASALAMRNLDNRETPRAFAIAFRAFAASDRDACELIERMRTAFDAADLPAVTRAEWERRAVGGTLIACTTARH